MRSLEYTSDTWAERSDLVRTHRLRGPPTHSKRLVLFLPQMLRPITVTSRAPFFSSPKPGAARKQHAAYRSLLTDVRPKGGRIVRVLAHVIHYGIALIGLATTPATVSALTASVAVDGHSFALGPAATIASGTGTSFLTFFTTYDGLNQTPLQDCAGGVCTFSAELSPLLPGLNQYRSDYLLVDNDVFEDGELHVALTASDADGDGVLDVLERTNPGDFLVAGTLVPQLNTFGNPLLVNDISVSVIRAAGAERGVYSGNFSSSQRAASISGEFFLIGAAGTVTYELDGSTLAWNLQRLNQEGQAQSVLGISSLIHVDQDTIIIPPFSLIVSGEPGPLDTRLAILHRSGSEFVGQLKFEDGNPRTSWSDFTDVRVKIVDNNDTNHDGLPDLILVPDTDAETQHLIVLLCLAILGCLSPRSSTL